MNLPLNPSLTMTIAADRHRTLVAEAEGSRLRKADRLARKAARKAARTTAETHTVPVETAVAPVARPQLQPVPTGAAVVRQHVAPSDLEHASARVA